MTGPSSRWCKRSLRSRRTETERSESRARSASSVEPGAGQAAHALRRPRPGTVPTVRITKTLYGLAALVGALVVFVSACGGSETLLPSATLACLLRQPRVEAVERS